MLKCGVFLDELLEKQHFGDMCHNNSFKPFSCTTIFLEKKISQSRPLIKHIFVMNQERDP